MRVLKLFLIKSCSGPNYNKLPKFTGFVASTCTWNAGFNAGKKMSISIITTEEQNQSKDDKKDDDLSFWEVRRLWKAL